MVANPINVVGPVNPTAIPPAAQHLVSATTLPVQVPTPPVIPIAALPGRPGFFTRFCVGVGAFLGTTVPAAVAQTPVSANSTTQTVPTAPTTDKTTGLANHISEIPWEAILQMGAIVGGAIILDRAVGKVVRILEADDVSPAKKYIRRGLRWGRRFMWGAVVFMGIKILGLNIGDVATGIIGGAAIVALTSKNLLSYAGSSLSLKLRGELEVGDYVQLWQASGRVKKITFSSVVLEGVDDNGSPYETTIPVSTIIGRALTEKYPDEAFFDGISEGQYISVAGKHFGKVVTKTKFSVGVEQEDAFGTKFTLHIDKRLITEDSTIVYKDIPPLPEGLVEGDKIELDGKQGQVVKSNEWYVWLKGENDAIHRIPRTAFRNTWTLIAKKPDGSPDDAEA